MNRTEIKAAMAALVKSLQEISGNEAHRDNVRLQFEILRELLNDSREAASIGAKKEQRSVPSFIIEEWVGDYLKEKIGGV